MVQVQSFVATSVSLGSRSFDITHRALVMGILNRTPDSFFSPAATYELDRLLERADTLIQSGADLLDIGGVKAGPGEEVSEQEELDRVIPTIEELSKRFECPISLDTWRSNVAKEGFAVGAVVGNDISGFADPNYVHVAAAAGASVIATHIRLRPRVADPNPMYPNVLESVAKFLLDRRQLALDAGIPEDRIILDAGLDLGKSPEQSMKLLRASEVICALGSPLLLSASNKTFLGTFFDLPVENRRNVSLMAAAVGIARGCRILRVHDVAGTVKVRDTLRCIMEKSN